MEFDCHFVARVLITEEGVPEFRGTGFLVSPDCLLTCAHVVCGVACEQCAELRLENDGPDSADAITILFDDKADSSIERKGTVMAWGDPDLVLVCLDPRVEYQPVRLVSGLMSTRDAELSEIWGSVIGFPGAESKKLTEFQLGDKVALSRDFHSQKLLNVQVSGGLPEGLSGSPLVAKIRDEWVCFGMAYLGGVGSATSLLVLSQAILDFLSRHSVTYLPPIEAADCLSPALGDLRRYSDLARKGLEPHILSRIQRAVVRDKYLPAIARGVVEGKKRIIPIVAPAGYGKSTVLGEIYDALTTDDSGWVLLLRCNDLIVPLDLAAGLPVSMGQAVSEDPRPIGDIVQRLTRSRGRGAILIDTLDLILDEQPVPALRSLFLKLTDLGATMVFTCRDHEYEAFVEPVRDRLAGLSDGRPRLPGGNVGPLDVVQGEAPRQRFSTLSVQLECPPQHV